MWQLGLPFFQDLEQRNNRNPLYWRQADVPAAADGAWHTAPLCQMLVCGVHVLDGTETHDVFKETVHTEARNAR